MNPRDSRQTLNSGVLNNNEEVYVLSQPFCKIDFSKYQLSAQFF